MLETKFLTHTESQAKFWNIKQCKREKVERRGGRTYFLHLQDRRINEAKNISMPHLNVGWHSRDYTSLYPSREVSSTRLRFLCGNWQSDCAALTAIRFRCFDQIVTGDTTVLWQVQRGGSLISLSRRLENYLKRTSFLEEAVP
jgi:hypothetical protein